MAAVMLITYMHSSMVDLEIFKGGFNKDVVLVT